MRRSRKLQQQSNIARPAKSADYIPAFGGTDTASRPLVHSNGRLLVRFDSISTQNRRRQQTLTDIILLYSLVDLPSSDCFSIDNSFMGRFRSQLGVLVVRVIVDIGLYRSIIYTNDSIGLSRTRTSRSTCTLPRTSQPVYYSLCIGLYRWTSGVYIICVLSVGRSVYIYIYIYFYIQGKLNLFRLQLHI